MFHVSMADCTSEEWLRDSANHLSYAFRKMFNVPEECATLSTVMATTVAPKTQSLLSLELELLSSHAKPKQPSYWLCKGSVEGRMQGGVGTEYVRAAQCVLGLTATQLGLTTSLSNG